MEERPVFDTDAVFNDDYLYFYADRLADERTEAEVDLIWRLLSIEPGSRILDLACGHGRVANRLAARGADVTGLDITELFLNLARADAAQRGVSAEYVHGDMRDLPWTAAFDRIVNWFTAYGYFDDEGNRRVLAEAARALRPDGQLLLELNHRDWIVSNFQPMHGVERGDDMMVDQAEIQPLTGRIVTRRTVFRAGTVRRMSFFVRLFTFTEIRDWLLQAGFSTVAGYGEDGGPLSPASRRMIVVATR